VEVDFEDLVTRLSLSKKRRPLLEVDDWKAKLQMLLNERHELYTQADLIVNITGLAMLDAADKLEQKLSNL
jgi:shikimate kinase